MSDTEKSRSSQYWPKNKDPEPNDEFFLQAHNLCLTFPMRRNVSNVSEQGLTEQDPRLVWDTRKRLRAIRALDNVSFELRSGDRLAVLGRNGSGKTTLLQILAGIIPPSQGYAAMRGRVTNLININVGVQMEASGHRNVTLRGLALGYTHRQIEEKRAEIAEFSELGSFLNMPLVSYSAGMRMRLTFAIATAFNPEILILDEWLSAGDVSFKKKATGRMQEFVSKAGILVLASHSRRLILDNCDKALWLDKGTVRQFGEVREVLNAYEEENTPTVATPPTTRAASA